VEDAEEVAASGRGGELEDGGALARRESGDGLADAWVDDVECF